VYPAASAVGRTHNLMGQQMKTTHRDPVAVEPFGLTSQQAAARLAEGGCNVLPQRHRIGWARRVLLQVRDPTLR
jgi:hypothetical protein